MTIPSSRAGSVRAGGLACIAGAVIAAVGATWSSTISSSVSPSQVSYPFTPATFRFTEGLWTLTHLLVLLGVLALACSGLAGSSRPARTGVWLAVTGMALLVPCELGYVFLAHAAEGSTGDDILGSAFGVAVPLAGIGFIMAGVTTLRAGRWQGPGRFMPVFIGVLTFLVLIPVQVARPSIFMWAIAVWNIAFILLGWALWQAARLPEVVPAPQPAQLTN
jgi:hypothetical protein